MPDTTSLISQVSDGFTRVGTECKTLHAETAKNASDLTSYKAEVTQAIADAKAAVKSELTNGASAAYDTFKELEDLMKANDDLVSALNAAKFIHYDAQELTSEQQTQARTNIGAAAAADLTTLNGTVTDHGTRLTTAEGSITDHGTRLTTAEGDIDALEAAVGDLTNVNFVTVFETALNANS